MKFYSEVTKKVYETVEALESAEKEVAVKRAEEEAARAAAKERAEKAAAEAKAKKEAMAKERGERAKEVEVALKELADLRKDCAEKIDKKQASVEELVNKFVNDFGGFHFTIHSGEDMPSISVAKYMKPFTNLFEEVFKNF